MRLVLIIKFLAGSPAWAVDLTRPINFQIPPQQLTRALLDFSHQAHVQIIVGPEVGGRTTDGILGTHSIGDALTILLRGSSLTYTVINDTSITVGSAAGLEKQLGKTPPLGAAGRANATAAASNSSTDAVTQNMPSSEDDATVLDEIVVTGTHIPGVAPVGSSVSIYTREDIGESGAATLDQFARNVTNNFASIDTIANQYSNIRFSATAMSNGTNTFQGASFNLRGLGPTATLTLLNGQRLAPSGLDGSFTDISQIPLSAIDRVEVLSDGASAIYGADAVGGVVNVITRKDFNGLETFVRYGGSTEGGADEVTASQLLGKSWSTGNILLNYEYDDQQGLSALQRVYIPDLGGPYSLIPQNRRNSVFVSGSQELTANTTFSGNVLYSDRQFSVANTVASPPSAFTQSTFASGSAEQLSVTAELDRALSGGWHADFTGSYSKNQQISDATTLIVKGSSNSSETLIQGASPSIVDVNAMTTGTLVSIPGGEVKAAFGASSRTEEFNSTDLETAPGQTATSSGEPDSRREVWSLYGEIVVPIIGETNAAPPYRRLDLSVAGRFDHYSDFGPTSNPKLGLSWEFVQGFFLKGTFGTSFQAPLLSQVHRPLQIETQLLPNAASATGSTDTIVIRGGNLGLLPEKSRSYTASFDLKPPIVPGYELSLNFFHIDFSSKITTPPTSSGSDYSLSDPLLKPFITHNPSLATVESYFDSPAFSGDQLGGPAAVEAIFDDRLTNLAATIESGIDLTTQFSVSFGPGQLNLSLTVERLLQYDTHAVYFAPRVSLLNTFAEPPKWKGRASAVWTQGPITASASLNFVNAYQNSLFTPPEPIGSWTTGDLYLGYRTSDSLPTPIRGLTIALSVTNVADAHPPRVQIPADILLPGEGAIPFDPANASPVGRVIALSLEKRW